jgi:predicted metal-dependent hydrolase
VAPARATQKRLDELVRQKGPWIIRRLKRQSDLSPPLPEREWVSGETYLYLGRQYRLKAVTAATGELVRLRGAALTLTVERGLSDSEKNRRARLALIRWYRDRAAEYLPRRAALWAPKLGLDAPRVAVSEPAKRWGSANADGTLRINWRVMQAPATVVDYVLVHELTHLVHQHHGREFWATMGRVMADYEERKKRLRELGPVLVW